MVYFLVMMMTCTIFAAHGMASAESDGTAQSDMVEAVKDVLEEHPKLIYDALVRYRQQVDSRIEQEASKAVSEHYQQVFMETDNAFVEGARSPGIQIVEFFDFNCGHCRTMVPVMAEVLKNNPDVQLISRPLALFGAGSQYAAEVAFAAYSLGENEYEKVTVAFSREKKILDKAKVNSILKDLGLGERIHKVLKDSTKPSEMVKENQKLSEDLKVMATPMYYLAKPGRADSILVSPGFKPEDAFNELINGVRNSDN